MKAEKSARATSVNWRTREAGVVAQSGYEGLGTVGRDREQGELVKCQHPKAQEQEP